MKYWLYSVIGLAVMVVLLYYLGVFGRQNQPSSSDQLMDQSTDGSLQKQWETQTVSRSLVTVAVTPVELSSSAQTWKFTIVLDTHSGELDQDLTQVALLLDDQGRTYRPTAWEGAGPGGHHREGTLIFNGIDPIPADISLKIKAVGSAPEFIFKWDIK